MLETITYINFWTVSYLYTVYIKFFFSISFNR